MLLIKVLILINGCFWLDEVTLRVVLRKVNRVLSTRALTDLIIRKLFTPCQVKLRDLGKTSISTVFRG